MKEPRIKSTESENIIFNKLGSDSNYVNFNMSEGSINSIVEREKVNKFNDQVDQFQSKLEDSNKQVKNAQDTLSYDILSAEIKPMFSRLIIKPFKINPFQKMEVKNGLIVDAGGYTPHAEINPVTGKYEEQKQFIITGYVVETGPDVKYLTEGDTVYYRVDTAVPVPFFKQGFVSVDEKQIIAVVNEGLSERFNSIKNNA